MPKLGRHLLAAAVAEDVGFVLAVGAHEVAHVLDDAERRDVQLLVHRDRAPAVGERHLLRRRHDDRAGDRHRLAEAERDVAGARRQIDDEIVEVRSTPLRGRTAAARRAASARAR